MASIPSTSNSAISFPSHQPASSLKTEHEEGRIVPKSPQEGTTADNTQSSSGTVISFSTNFNSATNLSNAQQNIAPAPERRKKKPYKELTLEEKVELIRMAEENSSLSQASIAEKYSIAKSNVCRILQRKAEYLRAFESAGFAGSRKRKLRGDLATNFRHFRPSILHASHKPAIVPIMSSTSKNNVESVSDMPEATGIARPIARNPLEPQSAASASRFPANGYP